MFFNIRLVVGLGAIAFSTAGVFTAAAQGGSTTQPAVAVCTQIKTAAQLQKMSNNLSGTYCLAKDIDLKSIDNFAPIGGSSGFTGRLYGNNHVISNLNVKTGPYAGLFSITDGAVIQDLALVDVKVVNTISGFAGALVGNVVTSNPSTITRVSATGKVKCSSGSICGGLLGSIDSQATVSQCSSAVDVSIDENSISGGLIGSVNTGAVVDRCFATGAVNGKENSDAGGLVGFHEGNAIRRSFSTGPVVAGMNSAAGGLVGAASSGALVEKSYAVGAATAGDNSVVGGLLGSLNGSSTLRQSFAAGAPTAGAAAIVGGLIGSVSGGTVDESYALGLVTWGTGAVTGGLIGFASGGPTVTNSYWNEDTTGQTTSAGGGGSGLTTDQLQARLRSGFSTVWAITKGQSFPFLNDPNIPLATPLSTLASNANLMIFLPISQLDKSNYGGSTKHIDQASLATTYTMLARAIGIGVGVNILKNVKTNKYFWNDNTQTTTFKGPVTQYVHLGTLKNISGAIGTEVTSKLNDGPVILRGSFDKPGGGTGTHYMLATLYTKLGSKVQSIVAHDPWTGTQVQIDPASKAVVSNPDFPLANFKVDGFQPATVQILISDIRLKRDIERIGKLPNGLGLYRYRYLWSDQEYVGVMAQEVARIKPAAVITGADGYLRVNYRRLGLRLQTWEEWSRTHNHPGTGALAALN